jgi:hypothetical protein
MSGAIPLLPLYAFMARAETTFMPEDGRKIKYMLSYEYKCKGTFGQKKPCN